MIALIDGDNIAYSTAASAEQETEEIAVARCQGMVETILGDVQATEYEVWLSGPTNFRKEVYPEYKANRIGKPRPKHEAICRQHLIDHWAANTSDGCEADDMLGVRQFQLAVYEDTEDYPIDAHWNSIICHLDKDMNQIPGWHYNWELRRLGEVIREKRTYFVTLEEADYYFFYQLLIGDNTDNIKGAVGIGPKKATGILQDCKTNAERLYRVQDLFTCEEELDMNAKCVYIWRKYKDDWRNLIT